jgi:hypothetical protein
VYTNVMSSGEIPPASSGGGIPPRQPPSGGKVAGAGGEGGKDEGGPRKSEGEEVADPLGIEPGRETKLLIAEIQNESAGQIVDRIVADRRVMLAVVRLDETKRLAVASELADRLPSLTELSIELSKDPLVLSLLAMLSEDIHKQALKLLNLPEDTEIEPPPGDRVEPPSSAEGGGLDTQV